jgi:nucleotide-binding universal stress UspA family protein
VICDRYLSVVSWLQLEEEMEANPFSQENQTETVGEYQHIVEKMNLMLRKILIAIGDVEESAAIFESGLTLADKFGTEVAIVHVLNLWGNNFESLGSSLMGGSYPIVNDVAIQQDREELTVREQHDMERLQSYVNQANDLNIKAEIFQNIGDPGQNICETAKKHVADLIVMGRHQQSAMSEIFLGSTSNYVLHHAPCSVMTIQP